MNIRPSAQGLAQGEYAMRVNLPKGVCVHQNHLGNFKTYYFQGPTTNQLKSEPGVRDHTYIGIIKAPLEILIAVRIANH